MRNYRYTIRRKNGKSLYTAATMADSEEHLREMILGSPACQNIEIVSIEELTGEE